MACHEPHDVTPHLRVRLIRIGILQVNPEREVKFLQCNAIHPRIQMSDLITFVPSSDSGDDFVWVCGPGDRLGIMVYLRDETIDGGLEIDYG